MTQHIKRQPYRRSAQRKSSSKQSPSPNTSPINLDLNTLTPEGIIQLQRQFGNKFVTNLLQRELNPDTSGTGNVSIQRKPQTHVIQRGGKEEEQMLINNDSVGNDFETLGFEPEPEEEDLENKNTNPFEEPENKNTNPFKEPENKNTNPFEEPENKNTNPFEEPENKNTNPFEEPENKNTNPFEEPNDEKQKGKDPNVEVDKYGFTGTVGKITGTGKFANSVYSTSNKVTKYTTDETILGNVGKGGKYVGKQIKNGTNDVLDIVGKGGKYVGKQVKNGVNDVLGKDNKSDTSGKSKGWWSKLKKAIGTIVKGIKTGLKASSSFLSSVMSAISSVTDILQDIAKYSIPFVSTIISAITGGLSVWSAWKTYSAYNIASKKAQKALEANTDEDIEAPLLTKNKLGKISEYAAAKTWRAFWSKLIAFGLTLGKGIAEIASLFTGGAAEAFALGMDLAKFAQKGVGYVKALYKIAKGTRGKKRSLNANEIVKEADGGNKEALRLLLDLGLTGDVWMIKLAAKLQVPYDPTYKEDTEVLFSRWLGKRKDEIMSFGSDKANRLSNQVKNKNEQKGGDFKGKIPKELHKQIKDYFVENDKPTAMALMIEPRTEEEMTAYLENLKKLNLYKDYTKEVMGSMKSN